MNPLLPSLSLLLLCAAPVAQISVSMSVPIPIDVTCNEGAASATDTQPAGPTNGYFERFTGTANTSAGMGASVLSGAWAGQFGVGFTATMTPAALPGSSATIGPAELLVQWQCPALTRVSWHVTFHDMTSAGLPQPSVDVDIGDDGIVDYINGQLASLAVPVMVGPQPLPVRIRFHGETQQPGIVSVSLGIDVRPDNDIYSTPVAFGCAGGIGAITATPTFQVANGVRLGAYSFSASMPWVAMVIGWGTLPVLLPSYGQAPCLFVPTPDIVLLQGFTTPGIDVPLPAAVRPVTFWIQGVIPEAQLLTTDCLRVDAY